MSTAVSSSVVPDLTLSLTADEIRSLTDQLISRLHKVGDEIASTPESDTTIENVLLKWNETDGEVATLQTKCTLGAMVSKDKSVREASSVSKKLLRDAWDACYSRKDLYDSFCSLKKGGKMNNADAVTKRFLDKTLQLFERNGLSLPDDKREKLIAIRKEICDLENKFQQNLNEDTTNVLFTAEELDGCPQTFIDTLETEEQQESGASGTTTTTIKKYRVYTKPPQLIVVMENAKLSDTRYRLLKASQTRCLQQNTEILERLVVARHKAAKLLGFPNHAAFRLDVNMAKTAETAVEFLKSVAEKLKPRLKSDVESLLKLKEQDMKERGEPFDGRLNLWDVSYYSRMLTKKLYNVDEEVVKEYFPLEHVTSQILAIYQDLLNVKFAKVEPSDGQVWSPEVQLYEVRDNSGSSTNNEILGYFYLDLFPRPGKYSHQCVLPLAPSYAATTAIASKQPQQRKQLPVAANIGNLSQPAPGRPSLLRHSEVRTFFHEFGHVMHCICTKSPYSLFSWAWSAVPYVAGVEMDFLEVPSQMLENWIWDPAVLTRLSKHFINGQTLPSELIHGLNQTRTVLSGYTYSRQIFMSLFDMYIHMIDDNESNNNNNNLKNLNLAELWGKVQRELTGLEMIPGTNPAASFYHLAMGYDAGYYSYLWSEVYSHDVFSRFKSSPNGGCFDTALGREYREHILAPGATLDGAEMLRRFLGREPQHDAFLKHLNLH